MSFEKLREQLDRCSGQIRPSKHPDELNPKSGYYQHLENTSLDENDPLIPPVWEIVASIPELKPYQDALLASAGESRSVNWWDIARWTLAQARVRRPEDVVKSLQDFVSTDSAQVSQVIALWGLNPTSPVKLTREVSIVPPDHLVPSAARDHLTGVSESLSKHQTIFPEPRMGAALKRDFVYKEILCKDRIIKKWDQGGTEIWEILKCLCLIKSASVCAIASWYESPLTTPLLGGIQMWATHALEPMFRNQVTPETYDEQEAQQIVGNFLKLSTANRRKLHIPLSRLNTALRSDNADNIALDLGIAIESLVGDRNDDIGYKVRLRGAFLIGREPEERRNAFDFFNKLYSLRSKVAHGGEIGPTVPIRGQAIATREFLKQCCGLCAKMIRNVISLGYFPDWDEAILTGAPLFSELE